VALLPSSLDMTDKDFDALRLRLIALARSVFPDWSDFAVASFGNVLLELYAFVGDVVGYYLDNQARESRLVTATQRKNVIALARTREVTEPVRFQLLADVVIPAGALQATGVVENSKTYVQLFDSRGLADLDIILDHTPYLDASPRARLTVPECRST